MPARKGTSSGSRRSSFLPVLIFLIGSGSFTIYQVLTLEDQLDQVTKAVDSMDAKVQRAEYEKAKFFSMAREVLRLAAKDPNAAQIATDFKLRQLQAAQPVLMALSTPSTLAPTNAVPAQATPPPNFAPMQPAQLINAPAVRPPSPTPK